MCPGKTQAPLPRNQQRPFLSLVPPALSVVISSDAYQKKIEPVLAFIGRICLNPWPMLYPSLAIFCEWSICHRLWTALKPWCISPGIKVFARASRMPQVEAAPDSKQTRRPVFRTIRAAFG